MISFPTIQIHQQPAKLGIDADIGRQSIEQPRASVEMESRLGRMEIESYQPELEIDQSRAWDALGLGNVLESSKRIYSQASNVALQGIARIVENGNRMAAIHIKSSAIAEIAQQEALRFFEFDYYGPASYDNVDIHFNVKDPDIHIEKSTVDIRVQVNKPVHDYERGKLDIYMLQYPKVTITPPQIDIRV